MLIQKRLEIFSQQPTSEIKIGIFCSTPILINGDNGVRIFITESGIDIYPGMFLDKHGECELHGKFARTIVVFIQAHLVL